VCKPSKEWLKGVDHVMKTDILPKLRFYLESGAATRIFDIDHEKWVQQKVSWGKAKKQRCSTRIEE